MFGNGNTSVVSGHGDSQTASRLVSWTVGGIPFDCLGITTRLEDSCDITRPFHEDSSYGRNRGEPWEMVSGKGVMA